MPINFTQLFRDSWNFVHNQRYFTYAFISAFFLLNFGIDFLLQLLSPPIDIPPNLKIDDITEMAQILQHININAILFSSIIFYLISILLSSWGILSIHYINEQNHLDIKETLKIALKKFNAVFILNLLIILPLVISLAMGLLLGDTIGLPILFAIFFAIFIFIRTCLAPVSYLITNKTLIESIQFIWQAGIQRNSTLFLYFLIIYFVFQLITHRLSLLSDNLFIGAIVAVIISFLNVFALVITYRFYTIFTQRA